MRLLKLLDRVDARVLDGQTPNIEIIAYRDNDIDDEASIDAESQAHAHEHERDLIDAIAKRARPAESQVALQEGTQAIGDAPDER